MKIRMQPIIMTAAAAARSPKNLTRRESREAETPVKNRAGTVPRPKAKVVKKPWNGEEAVAAFTIMAQESMQGRKPTAIPKASLAGNLSE